SGCSGERAGQDLIGRRIPRYDVVVEQLDSIGPPTSELRSVECPDLLSGKQTLRSRVGLALAADCARNKKGATAAELDDFAPVMRDVEASGPGEIRSRKHGSIQGELDAFVLESTNVLEPRRYRRWLRDVDLENQVLGVLDVVLEGAE